MVECVSYECCEDQAVYVNTFRSVWHIVLAHSVVFIIIFL